MLHLVRAIPLCYISMVYFNTVLNATIYNYLKGVYIMSWLYFFVIYVAGEVCGIFMSAYFGVIFWLAKKITLKYADIKIPHTSPATYITQK